MKILGINALNHDAAITLIEDDKILFAAHAERYSGIKNDSNLNIEMFLDMFDYGMPERVVYFERPWEETQTIESWTIFRSVHEKESTTTTSE